MVGRFCTSKRLPSDTAIDVDYLQNLCAFPTGIYDLVCNGIRVFDPDSVYFIDYWNYYI